MNKGHNEQRARAQWTKLSPLSRNTLRVLCLFAIIPLSHGSDDSVTQSMDGVCSSNLPARFQALSTPTEEYCKTSTAHCGSVWVTLTFWWWKRNLYPLRTETTRTLRWKCAIRVILTGKGPLSHRLSWIQVGGYPGARWRHCWSMLGSRMRYLVSIYIYDIWWLVCDQV